MNKENLLPKVFLWMFGGLLITFLTGYVVSVNTNMLSSIFSGYGYLICVIVELALVFFLSARIMKMQPTTAKIVFILYAFVSGLTFSSIFVVYELTSVLYVFLITAVVFGMFAFLGATTKLDLTKLGTYLMMGLIAVLICLIVNMFINSTSFDLLLSIIIILIFIGFTAYDMQKILRIGANNLLPEDNLAIYGALQLYLDFINLFIEFLKFFGNDRN